MTADASFDLYETLNASKDDSTASIKKSYYKLALKYHPDKCVDLDANEAKERFQKITLAYNILSDDKKRAYYDKMGTLPENDLIGINDDVYKVKLSDIIEYEKNYKGSEEEKQDLIDLYFAHKGDLLKIIDDLFFGSLEEQDRYRNILQEQIDSEKITKFEAFGKTNEKELKKRKRKADKEAKEALAAQKELGIDSKNEADLAAIISKRQGSRMDSMIKNLEEKYAKPTKKKSSKKQ